MNNGASAKLSYFPGCSLATTAKENDQSLRLFAGKCGIELVELDDWNCCGSSSAHSIDTHLALQLAGRNLALAPPDRPLLIACPGCFLRLRHAHHEIKADPEKQRAYQAKWKRAFDPDLKILHFFDLLTQIDPAGFAAAGRDRLAGLKFAPYYGCMLSRPPAIRREPNHHGILENIMAGLGAQPVKWPHHSRCCGTYLSVARPAVVSPIVNQIVQSAVKMGAECIITACAMCHLNLEIRCTQGPRIPILHFSEVLALAMGLDQHPGWFARHLIDPLPLLKQKGLVRP